MMAPVPVEPADSLAERAPDPRWNRWDAAALLGLLAATVALNAALLRNPLPLLTGDMILFFLPLFDFLGDSLRAGAIPAWNPHQFMGAPFTGDPQSGWMSLPVMLLFALLPLHAAVVAFIVVHQVIAAAASYALGRLLGMNPAGALTAAAVLEFTLLHQRTRCCPQIVGVVAWAPVMLLAAEMALRARSPLPRAGWLLLGGLAVNQELASWLGQGSYYQLVLLGGWIAFRSLLWPVDGRRRWPGRIADFILTSAAIVGSGLLMNAAALLPRLEFNRVSNIAGGQYLGPEAGWSSGNGGFELPILMARLFGGFTIGEWLYAGAAATALALLCPFVAPRWRPLLFFGPVALAMVLLALPRFAPLEALAFLLPGFEIVHSHYRERITHGLTLPIGLLAGASVTALTAGARRSRLAAMASIGILAVFAWLAAPDRQMVSLLAVAAVAAVMSLALAALVAPRSGILRGLLAVAFAVALIWDATGRMATTGRPLSQGPYEKTFASFEDPGGAARILEQHAPGEWRYFGFDPGLLGPELSTRRGYAPDPGSGVVELLVAGNQASAIGLDDLQGYNPVHPMRYVEWIRALNGKPQLYRFGNVYPAGLDSPLLDLSNVRYAVVLAESAEQDPVVRDLAAGWQEVSLDGRDRMVRVLENPDAAPRAWLTGEARLVVPGEALDLLASGAVDGRTVALVEDPARALPPVDWDASAFPLTVTRPDSDRIVVTLPEPAAGPAMLVVSEVHDAGWRATADGEHAPVAVVDHTLIGVPVPAGTREIVLDYDPPSLRFGIAISLLAFAGAAAVWIANGVAVIRRREGGR